MKTQFFLWLLLSVAALFTTPVMAATGLPAAKDLRADALQAGRGHVPVLVYFSAESCSYCKEVEELYLRPMYADAAYRDKVIIRQVDIESTGVLRDFSGKRTNGAAFARRYGVSVTPTIKLLDAKGRELVPALVGVSSPDFYGSYLDAAIIAADAKLREHPVSRPSLSTHRYSTRRSAAETSDVPSASPTRHGAG